MLSKTKKLINPANSSTFEGTIPHQYKDCRHKINLCFLIGEFCSDWSKTNTIPHSLFDQIQAQNFVAEFKFFMKPKIKQRGGWVLILRHQIRWNYSADWFYGQKFQLTEVTSYCKYPAISVSASHVCLFALYKMFNPFSHGIPQ